MKYTPFLRQIALHFYKEHRDELFTYRFYFQNRRAGLFFLHYLKEIAGADGATLLLPEVTTLVDELYHVANLDRPDPNNDLFVVYEMYGAILQAEEEYDGEGRNPWTRLRSGSFSDFYRLGSLILGDYDDIDKQLADAGKIYQNAHELLEIDLSFRRSFTEEEKRAIARLLGRGYDSRAFSTEDFSSEYVKSFVSTFSLLSELYVRTKERLREKQLFYTGMLLRDAVEDDSHRRYHPDTQCTHVIVGLNALSQSEKKLLSIFHDEAHTLFYWDYSGVVFQSENIPTELGRIKSDNLKNYPMPVDRDRIDFEVVDSLPDVEMVAIPSKVAETVFVTQNRLLPLVRSNARYAGATFSEKVRNLEVAIVLPNERLLMPLLSTLPGEVEEVNITMGYPLRETPLAGAILHMLSLFRYLSARTKGGSTEPFYLLSEVMQLLSLKSLEPLWGSTNLVERIHHFLLSNKIFRIDRWTLDQLRKIVEEEYGEVSIRGVSLSTLFSQVLVFPPVEKRDESGSGSGRWLLEYFVRLLTLLTQIVDAETQDDGLGETLSEDGSERMVLSEATVYHFLLRLLEDRVSALFGNGGDEIDIDQKVMSDLLKGLITSARIPYEGEPLKGLQVIGILETRTLDFDTIFIPDASEGVLPSHSGLSSLIPHDIRVGNNLPTYKWQEVTRAYNFFSLISRASKVYATYDSRKNENSDGEPSRYFRLLEYIYGPNLGTKIYTAGVASYTVRTSGAEREELEINLAMVESFRESLMAPRMTTKDDGLISGTIKRPKAISASALNTYLTCPKLFYFKYVEGRRDDTPSNGLLEEKDKGDLLHVTLKRLYEPFLGTRLRREALESIASATSPEVHETLMEVFRERYGDMSPLGFNANELMVVEDYIRRVMTFDSTGFDGWIYVGGEVHFSGRVVVPPLAVPDEEKVDAGKGVTKRATEDDLLVNITGDIDRLLFNPNSGTLLVIDFKTGSDRSYTSVNSILRGDFQHVVTQLSFYSLVAGLATGGKSDDEPILFDALSLETKVDLSGVKCVVPAMFKPLEGAPARISFGSANEVIDFMNQSFVPDKMVSKEPIPLKKWFAEEIFLSSVRAIAQTDDSFDARKTSACKYCMVRDLCPTASRSIDIQKA